MALTLLIGGGIAAYLYFQDAQQQVEQAHPVDIQEIAPPTILPEATSPQAPQVLEDPAEMIELPQLESSDNFMGIALASLVTNKALTNIFSNNELVRNIVVTIDNLPRKQVTMRFMPIKKAPGKFTPMEITGETFIDPNNSRRYAPYMNFAKAVDPKQLVELYIQLYPLFQKSYEELGYPDQYFNDRMIVVLDHLIATPEIDEPAQLVQPKYFYQYADPALENRSIGQRILMRIGNDNQNVIKTKLQAIKQELMLHMHEQKTN